MYAAEYVAPREINEKRRCRELHQNKVPCFCASGFVYLFVVYWTIILVAQVLKRWMIR
jgi:hypothetical protein